MSPWRTMLVTIAAGLLCALFIGRLAALEQGVQERRSSIAAVAPHAPATLSDDNLADAMAGFRFNERMTRVGWDHAILSVDLTVRDGGNGNTGIWEDTVELIRFSFLGTANVRQLLIRIYRETGDVRTLLFYGDTRKADWTRRELARLRPPAGAEEAVFLRKIRLAATPAGSRMLRNLAN